METPFFHELRRQASSFLRDKVRTARLALTDVTPAQLLTEEATSASSSRAPDAKTMGCISRAAFEIDDYWRIVQILHRKFAPFFRLNLNFDWGAEIDPFDKYIFRFDEFESKQWREAYRALILLEHLLTHGPASIAEEFQDDRQVIQRLGSIQFIDERGFNWGLTVRDKTERVLKLLEKGQHLKEERERARKLSRGIQGFGSFNPRWPPPADRELTSKNFGRSASLREHSLLLISEKENSTCDATRKEARREERVLFQELSGNKILAIVEATGNPTTKVHVKEESESKPLLAH